MKKLSTKLICVTLFALLTTGCGGGSGGSGGWVHQPQISIGCGNGIVESEEQCDDGNTTNNDGCSSLCKIGFSKTFGGSSTDRAYSIQQTTEGGYTVTGETYVSSEFYSDMWVSKHDSKGNQEWSLVYDGNRAYSSDSGSSIMQTSDGGYVVAGISEGDLLVMKINSSGNETWIKTFNYIDLEYEASIQQTADGGYIVLVNKSDCDSCDWDAWILKLDSSGNKIWDKVFSTSVNDYGSSLQQTTDGGYIVGGSISPYYYQEGDADVWVLKLDSTGNEVWSKTFGGSANDRGFSAQQTKDGGYIVVGYTASYGAGETDIWLLKLDSSGNETWSKTFGGSALDEGKSVHQTVDGGYIIAGYTKSSGAGEKDVWILKTDASGSQAWEKTYGGAANDAANSSQQTKDGGFIVAGYTDCSEPEYYNCGADIWVLKLDTEGNCNGCVF